LPDVITTTLENGQQSKVESDYQFPVLDPNGYHYSDGNVIAQREYDYGAGAPGPLRRTTTKTYLAASNSNYGNQNLMSLLSSTNVDDGVLRNYAFFNYDEYTLANSG